MSAIQQCGLGLLVYILLLLPLAASPCPPIRSTHFDGSPTARAEFKYQTSFDATVPMTLEAWVYREDGNRCETIISHDYTKSWWFGFCPRLRFYRQGGSADADLDVPANQWTHVAASYDGKTVQFYINGAPAGTKPLSSGPGLVAAPVIVGENACCR